MRYIRQCGDGQHDPPWLCISIVYKRPRLLRMLSTMSLSSTLATLLVHTLISATLTLCEAVPI